MNCELPATGVATTASVLIAVCLLVGGCGVLLWARRADRRALFCGVLVVVSAAGLATSHPTEAANNCVTTTAAPATLPPTTVASESSAPASTVPGTTIAATSTSTTTSTTTTTTTVVPTTVPVVAFCGTLVLDATHSLDVSISMEGGAGTYTALVPPSGACDGEVLDSGPAARLELLRSCDVLRGEQARLNACASDYRWDVDYVTAGRLLVCLRRPDGLTTRLLTPTREVRSRAEWLGAGLLRLLRFALLLERLANLLRGVLLRCLLGHGRLLVIAHDSTATQRCYVRRAVWFSERR